MKKILFFGLLSLVIMPIFSQQLLWSTLKEEEGKVIDYEEVINEVIVYYELYDNYYDYTGYTKETFKKFLVEEFQMDETSFDRELNKKNVDSDMNNAIAFRIPIEGGSAIWVLCVNGDNVNLVVFSNVSFSNSNSTYNGDLSDSKQRFIRWFNTLL